MSDRVSTEIHKFAVEEARYVHAEKAGLEQEKLKMERYLQDIQLKLDAANLAHNRLADFRVALGAHYQCPRCWIRSGKVSDLRCVGSDNSDDIFHCHTCGLEMSVA